MKKILLTLAVVTLLALPALSAPAEKSTPAQDTAGFGVLVGYKSVSVDEVTTAHNTHPDDMFLPNSWIPGSAGETSVGGRLHFAALGMRYRIPVSKSFSVNLDAGGLIGGERDGHKNANDTRPDSNAAFVYSKARFGVFGALGVSYHIDEKWYIGAEGQITGIFMSSGWDRWATDTSTDTEFKIAPSVGPKIGIALGEKTDLELSILFGNSVTWGAQIFHRF
jgi:hypothetical protein